MDSHTLLTLWILSAVGLCSCQSEIQLNGPLNGKVGGNVTFHLTNLPSQLPDSVNWQSPTNILIITFNNGAVKINPAYGGRVSFDQATFSLKIWNLTLDDTGEYTVTININFVVHEEKTSLTVLEKISNVKAEASLNELVEFNSSVILSCSASGTSPSYRWFNRSAVVTDSNRTLTILNVTRYDIGPYKCEASNILNNENSSDVNLKIAYGPDNADIVVDPESQSYISGSNITLSCSSVSSPSAQFQWALKGTLLGRQGPELRLEKVQASQSGAYSCWAYNIKTQRYKPSSPKTFTVLVGVSGPNITHSDEVLIAGRSSVNLTCNAAQGSNITREWTKDGSPLSSSNNVIISEDKATVSISPVEKGDRGEYKCKLSNPVSAAEATIMLNVYHGPAKPHIEGKKVIKIGNPIHLTCTAESNPQSTYKWTFKGKETSGASYSKDQSEFEDRGNYTCSASNSITGITSTAVFELFVEEVTSGLTTGAIVGIAVGVIFAILIAGIGLALFLKKKGKLGAPKRHQAPDQRPNGSVELNYADISQFQKKDGQKVNVGSSEAAGPQSKQFSNKGFGLRATAGNRANTGDQSTEYAAAKPKGQASGPPYQAEDVTYAQVRK